MSITVSVGLLSGKTVSVSVCLDEEVEVLKCRAQAALGVGKARLLDSSGKVLDTSTAVEDSAVRNGDALNLQISRVQACGSERAFCAILGDGSAVTCGVLPTLVVTIVLRRVSCEMCSRSNPLQPFLAMDLS
eukprot:s360_g5.t1